MNFNKFFTINNLQQISGKYSKNTLTTDRKQANKKVKFLNSL